MKNLPRAIPRVALATALVGSWFVTVGPAPAAEVQIVSNPSFEVSTESWVPSANSLLGRNQYSGGATFGTVRRKTSKGSANIWARTHSSDPLPLGSTIKVSGRISSREPGRKIRFMLREFSPDGTRVQQFAGILRPSTSSWRWAGSQLVTQGEGNTVRLFVKQLNTRSTKALRIRDIQETITLGEGVDPDDPNDLDQGEPVESTTASCEDIDYSDPEQGFQTFGDEFLGTKVDSTKWRVRDQTYLSFDDAWISKDNVSVHDGVLDIMGLRKDEPKEVFNPPGDRYYSTGYLDTMDSAAWGNPAADRFSQKYGYFEMRAKVPTEATMSRGIWPAFWLRGDSSSGEIDVMEAYGAPNTQNFNFDYSATYQWSLWANTNRRGDGGYGPGTPNVGDSRISDDFHTYAINWSPTCMRFLFDGRTVGMVTPEQAPFIADSRFDSPFNIRLNMQVGSDYWGHPSSSFTRPEFHYLIDHVRVFQANPAD